MTAEAERVSLDEQRSRLTLRATVVRARLLRTIDVLDTRRRNAQEVGQRAKRLAMPLAGTLIGGIAIGAGLVFAMRTLVVGGRQRRLSDRLARVMVPFRAADKPSFWREALRKVLFNTLIIVSAELARRGARALIGGRRRALLPGHEGAHASRRAEKTTRQPVLASPAPPWNLD